MHQLISKGSEYVSQVGAFAGMVVGVLIASDAMGVGIVDPSRTSVAAQSTIVTGCTVIGAIAYWSGAKLIGWWESDKSSRHSDSNNPTA